MNAHIYTEKTVSAGTVTRTICLTVALANQLLSAMGKPILPIENPSCPLRTAPLNSWCPLASPSPRRSPAFGSITASPKRH